MKEITLIVTDNLWKRIKFCVASEPDHIKEMYCDEIQDFLMSGIISWVKETELDIQKMAETALESE